MNPLIAAELATVLKPLDDMFTALQTPGVNTQSVVTDSMQLVNNEIHNLPAIETLGITGIAALLQTQLRAKLLSPAGNSPSAPGAANAGA